MTIDVDALRPRLAAALGNDLQLGDLLGTGGFAAVFRARDPFLERDVAIKVLDPDLALSTDLEEQFLREARTIAGTEHPHIVPLYAAEVRQGLLYLVMRLVPGQSLADRIGAGKLPAADAARLALETARALATAHANNVVHRDIKPDNILLDASGHATVTDFGIARVTTRPPGELAGMTVGTPNYMSPEQAMGEEVDGRSDVYSLGVVLFEMLAGRPPFEGRSVMELISKHISAVPPRVSELEPATPAALVTLVERMLAKTPSARPDAAELVKALVDASMPERLLSPRAMRMRRWRKRAGYVAMAVIGAGVAGYFGVRAVARILALLVPHGADPVLLISGSVPDSLTVLARREGSLRADERPTLAFIPAGHTAADALLLTDSVLIRRSATGARRIVLRHRTFDIFRTRGRNDSAVVGYFVVTAERESPDTLYHGLSSTEVQRLTTEIAAWARARTRTVSDSAGPPQ